jgi:perosamine synthetase
MEMDAFYIFHSKPTITLKDENQIRDVIASRMISRGNKVAEFENRIAHYLGLKGGVATSSGSSGIYWALKALGIKKGDEVVLPTYVCPTVLFAVNSLSATPVLCDVSNYWNIDANTVKPHLTSKTRAIIAPHIGGIPIDIEPIIDLGIPVIEDLAQSFGAEIRGKKVGTFGQVAVCSFQAIKCITTGEGGMVLSDNQPLIHEIKETQILSPISDIQASLGLSQLEQYPSFLRRRRQIADIFFTTFEKYSGTCMPLDLRLKSIFFRFPLRIKASFSVIKAEFEEKNIAVRQFIDSLLHRDLGLPKIDFPNAEKCFSETLSIPIYPSLSDYQVQYIAKIGELLLSKHNAILV